MPKYRKLPVVIEAWQWPGKDQPDMPDWLALRERAINAHILPGQFKRFDHGRYLSIATLEGEMRAYPDDWIIKGVNGEIYPCKPDVFAKTYEPADTPEAITRQMTDAILHGQGVTITHIPIVDMIDAALAVDTTDITEGALDPGVVSNGEPTSSSGLPDDWFEEHDGQRLVLIPEKVRQHIAELEAQLQAEGEHTAAANANIDRLNTEIERITRRQQGPLMGKE